ncbi:MAG: PQQ-dependent sugar dehydrogenase [Candidatus Latescibacterota bacterium]|nr:PQQ-dependent sugar dehydrogenase [Candidatus Latescibacterota bacterium]
MNTLLLILWIFALVPPHSIGQNEYRPGQARLAPTVDLHLQPVPVDGLPNRTVNLPPGFKIKVFSKNVKKARFMAFDEEGVLHVANMHTKGSSQWSPDPARKSNVIAMPDRDGDGNADTTYVAADNFLWPHSVAFYRGNLYVADHDMVYKLEDRDEDGYYEIKQPFIKVPGIMGRSSEHITHTLVFDESEDVLYLHAGSGCDVCREDDPERATILKFNADGSNRRIFATGLRNAIGMDLHPVTGQLWANGNGHDREGKAIPPEWINIITENSFHGWPLAYGWQKWVDFSISQYRKEIFPLTSEDSTDVASMRRPVALVPAHLAPMGLHFYAHDQFPPMYNNTAFVAFRAGVLGNDVGYKVSAVFSNADGTNARVGDFLTGFRPNPNNNTFWGTPVGLITDKAGYLYLSSDRFTQAIFRIEASPLQGIWENPPPDSLKINEDLEINSVVRIIREKKSQGPITVTADLSQFNGSNKILLSPVDDNSFTFYSKVPVGKTNGIKTIKIHLYQGGDSTSVVKSFIILPDKDKVVFDDLLLWEQGVLFAATISASKDTVYSGDSSMRFNAKGFTVGWNAKEEIPSTGYDVLRFAFHPGTAEGGFRPALAVSKSNGEFPTSILEQIDFSDKTWQTVNVAITDIAKNGIIDGFRLAGSFRGTFYIDDVRLVAQQPSEIPTAIEENRAEISPKILHLEANYPNPFNSSTTLTYHVNLAGRIRLIMYNLNGQRIRTLVEESHRAGTFQTVWDGKNDNGKNVASGVYIACLSGDNGNTQVRKLLLIK